MSAADTVTDEPSEDSSGGSHGRAGRNLVAAASVGALLGAVVLAALLWIKVVFVGVVVVLVGVAVYELALALRPTGVRLPPAPLLFGVALMLVGAYVGGTNALVGALGFTAVAVCAWRIAGGREGFVRDVTASTFVVLYVPFLASFAILLLRPEDGPYRVVCFLAVTVASDLGGYFAGVLFGRHQLAPEISPKKSWEGLAGSAVLCLATGITLVTLLLDGPWWAGLILGAVAPAMGTLGDLFVSMLKRDVGIKDMGSFLPGHGGIMDRLDSLLPMAMISWFLLSLLVPA